MAEQTRAAVTADRAALDAATGGAAQHKGGPFAVLADAAESAGLARAAARPDVLESVTRLAWSTGERMAVRYGDQSHAVESQAVSRLAFAAACNDDVFGDALRLARVVKDAARDVIRNVRESTAVRSTGDDGPPVATFTTWSPDARVARAERYTSGTLSVTQADAVLAARSVYAWPRQTVTSGGTVTTPELRTAERSAESTYWRLVSDASTAGAVLAVFGDDVTAALDAAYRPQRYARRGDKRTGRKRGDVTRGRYVAWSKVGAARTDVRSLARQVRPVAAVLAERLTLPAHAAGWHAKTTDAGPPMPAGTDALASVVWHVWHAAGGMAAVTDWTPRETDAARADAAARKRALRAARAESAVPAVWTPRSGPYDVLSAAVWHAWRVSRGVTSYVPAGR